jgi:CSLREA domain-containing protein
MGLALVVAIAFGALASTAQAAYVQQGSKLTASGTTELGEYLAISADGDTALVGENSAASTPGVFVFVKTASGWHQQAELTGGPEGSGFGAPVALSANGNTAIVGASETASPNPPGENNYGAVWIYTRSGTIWSPGQEIQPSNESPGSCYSPTLMTYLDCSNFGSGVALSSNGTEALIGGPGDTSGEGAVWVYTESGGNWSEATKVVPSASGSAYGEFVSLSSDGGTALLSGAGATALVYTGSGASWSLQQALQFPADSGLPARYSTMSSNGATALLGDASSSNGTNDDGLVAVYDRSSNTWTNTATLSNAANTGCSSGTCDGFGSSLALSSDGDTALVGSDAAPSGGAAWIFSRPSTSSAWTQSQTLAPNDENNSLGNGNFGSAVGLSADGSMALVGGDQDDGGLGAAWVFAAPPSLVVNSTGDAGEENGATSCNTGNTVSAGAPECTLRAAIQTANATGGGTITFDLPAQSVITPASALPSVSSGVTIDGSGVDPVIDGTAVATGLNLESSVGLILGGSGDGLEDVTVQGFYTEVDETGGNGHVSNLTLGPGPQSVDVSDRACVPAVPGNVFDNRGLLVDSSGNQVGPAVVSHSDPYCNIVVLGSNNTIGGVSLKVLDIEGDNNTVTGSLGGSGVASALKPNDLGGLGVSGNGNTIQGTGANSVGVSGNNNTIGAPGGSALVANELPSAGDEFTPLSAPCASSGGGVALTDNLVEITGSHNVIEGDDISGDCIGIFAINGTANVIRGNQIGGNGATAAPQSGGILIQDSSANQIDSNAIVNNPGSGIAITGDTATGNTISDNSISGNGGLGIDLRGTGSPTDIDRVSFATATGPNHLLSYPTVLHATHSGDKLRLVGGLEGVPGGERYRIEVFSNDRCGKDGYGEGQHLIGSFDANTFGTGRFTHEADFDATVALHGSGYADITETATDSEGDTSEFSKCGDGFPGLAANLLDDSAATAANGKGIAGIVKGGGLSASGAATGSETVKVQASASASSAGVLAGAARAGKLVILTGTLHVKRAGGFVLKLHLTAAGRRLLKRAKKLTITFTATCKVGHHRYRARRTITLSRKRKRA